MIDNYIGWLTSAIIPTIKAWGGIFGGMVIFLILEKIYPVEKKQNPSGITTNIFITLIQFIFNFFTVFFTGLFVVKIVSVIGGPIFDINLTKFINTQDGLLKLGYSAIFIFIPFLVHDFFYYWFHRAQHENHFLWLQHKFHHADKDLNVTTVHRHHWLEEILRTMMIYIPMGIIFKVSPYEIAIFTFVLTYWSHFFHSNLRLHLGPIARIFLGPQAHRIHHSILDKHKDKNFAAFFPIWDILFGTFYNPQKNEYPPTGVKGEPSQPQFNYFMWEPLVGIIRELKNKKRLNN